jgi:hypothetical protein
MDPRITQQILQYRPTAETLQEPDNIGKMTSEMEQAVMAYLEAAAAAAADDDDDDVSLINDIYTV